MSKKSIEQRAFDSEVRTRQLLLGDDWRTPALNAGASTECVGEVCDCGRDESNCACDHAGVHMDLDSFMKGYRLCVECGEEFPMDELENGLCLECEEKQL